MIIDMISAVLSLGLMGLVLGAVLAMASRVFHVEVDYRIPQIVEALPGANCGGCGFPGCSAYADNIVNAGAKTNLCPVGGDEVAAAVAGIMGVSFEKTRRMCANVACAGCNTVAQRKYDYKGISDCNAAMRMFGGSKSCPYSCIGLGTCEHACKFGAIAVYDGVAYVDRDKCAACGMCAASCPKHIISLVPYDSQYYVACSSNEKGAAVRPKCEAGCIACSLCVKACEFDAIHVIDNLARIDYDKCVGCGKCAEKCPRKIIHKTTIKPDFVELPGKVAEPEEKTASSGQ